MIKKEKFVMILFVERGDDEWKIRQSYQKACLDINVRR